MVIWKGASGMILLGNGISFVGCLLMISIGFIKKKEHILTAQCGQFTIQGVAHLMLGAMSGVLACVVSILRIVAFTKLKPSVWLKVGFMVLQALLTIAFGADSFVDWLPVLSMVLYTWYLDTDSAVVFKLVNMAGLVMWVIYDLLHMNYVGFSFDILTIISTTIGIALVYRERKLRQ